MTVATSPWYPPQTEIWRCAAPVQALQPGASGEAGTGPVVVVGARRAVSSTCCGAPLSRTPRNHYGHHDGPIRQCRQRRCPTTRESLRTHYLDAPRRPGCARANGTKCHWGSHGSAVYVRDNLRAATRPIERHLQRCRHADVVLAELTEINLRPASTHRPTHLRRRYSHGGPLGRYRPARRRWSRRCFDSGFRRALKQSSGHRCRRHQCRPG